MRVSVEEDDLGYNILCHVAIEAVLIDGRKVEHCITADEETGYIKAYITDRMGNFVEQNGEIQTIEFRGKVQIQYSPGYNEHSLNEFAGKQ